MTNALQVLFIKVKQVNRVETDDLCRSDDSQWWLKWGGRRRETHSPCLYLIPARNSSHRCLSSLLSRSLRGDTTRARKHYSAVCSGKSFATALSLSVKLIVCVHDRELCLLAFKLSCFTPTFNCNQELEVHFKLRKMGIHVNTLLLSVA